MKIPKEKFKPVYYKTANRFKILFCCLILNVHEWELSDGVHFYDQRCANCGIPRK